MTKKLNSSSGAQCALLISCIHQASIMIGYRVAIWIKDWELSFPLPWAGNSTAFSMMWCSFLANQGVELLEQTNYCNIILCMYCAVTSLYVKFWLKSIRGMLKLHSSTYHFAWSAHIHQCVVVVIGRRSCIGEGLARMKQFLIFSTIMQRYTVKLAECSQHVTDEPKQGLGLTPQDYKIIYTSRQQA